MRKTSWALVILTLSLPGSVLGDSISTEEDRVSATEGESVTLRCSYSTTASSSVYLYWYRQYPGRGPEYILERGARGSTYANTAAFAKERFSSTATDDSTSLSIRELSLSDTATYYCALRDSGSSQNKLIFGTGTQLLVRPNVTNPQPRMYRLKKPQVNDLSICLFTDFGKDEVNMTGIRNIMRAPSVVDVKRLESKSLGIVAWDNSLDWDCQAQASEAVYSLSNSSGKVCNAEVVTENFSSDPYLNSRNLAMIFLRVVFVKTMGFNLLMTLKLWSS
nr:T cell receptor alpha [Tachyglossus aculeatus]